MSKYGGKFNRQTLPRRSLVSKMNENEVDKLMKDIDHLDDSCKSVLKDCRLVSESYSSVVKAEGDVVIELMSNSSDPAFQKKLTIWSDMVDCKAEAVQTMNQVLNKSVSEPTKKFLTFCPSLNAFNKRREQALQDVMKLQTRVEKYENRERTGPNIVKLTEIRKALASAWERYEQLNNLVLEDGPHLNDARLELMQPALRTAILGHISLYQSLHDASSRVTDALGEEVDMLLTAGTVEAHLAQRLAEITSLAIVVDSSTATSGTQPPATWSDPE